MIEIGFLENMKNELEEMNKGKRGLNRTRHRLGRRKKWIKLHIITDGKKVVKLQGRKPHISLDLRTQKLPKKHSGENFLRKEF